MVKKHIYFVFINNYLTILTEWYIKCNLIDDETLCSGDKICCLSPMKREKVHLKMLKLSRSHEIEDDGRFLPMSNLLKKTKFFFGGNCRNAGGSCRWGGCPEGYLTPDDCLFGRRCCKFLLFNMSYSFNENSIFNY